MVNQFAHNENYKFLLVGDGKGRKNLEKLFSKKGYLNNVKFSGNVTNIAAYLSAMDIFILPSRFEGLPMCALEAQANGLHTIVSNKVSSETACSIHFSSIKLSAHKWFECIRNLNLSYNRSQQEKFLNLKQIEIEKTAKQLEALYNQRG